MLDRAWGLMEWSPDRMRKLISQCETREVFFERIQKLWEKEGIEPEVPEYPFELIQEATRRVLREEGLLGLGRRSFLELRLTKGISSPNDFAAPRVGGHSP